jgi:hypothetical protein
MGPIVTGFLGIVHIDQQISSTIFHHAAPRYWLVAGEARDRLCFPSNEIATDQDMV